MAASMAGAVDLSGLKQRAQSPPASSDAAAPGAGGVTEVTEANFETEVLIRSVQVPVVVVLWSPRSDASVQLVDTFGALAAEDAGSWAVAAVNVDTTPRVAQMFGVQAVPTVVALAGGKPLDGFQGAQPADQLRKWIDALLSATAGKLEGGPEAGEPEQVDPALAAARDALDAGDFDAAKTAYEAILAGNPNHAEAKGAVRQIGFLARATGHGPGVVATADASPSDIDAAFAAADVQLLNQDVVGAFNRLIALVKTTAGDERASVRTRLIELFELFDPADPDVLKARRDLANALY